MGLNETYVLHRSIWGIHSVGGHRPAIKVPVGATITTVAGPLDGLRQINVSWEGKMIAVFKCDLQERANLIREAVVGPRKSKQGNVRKLC